MKFYILDIKFRKNSLTQFFSNFFVYEYINTDNNENPFRAEQLNVIYCLFT